MKTRCAVIWLICFDSSQIIESERCQHRWNIVEATFRRQTPAAIATGVLFPLISHCYSLPVYYKTLKGRQLFKRKRHLHGGEMEVCVRYLNNGIDSDIGVFDVCNMEDKIILITLLGFLSFSKSFLTGYCLSDILPLARRGSDFLWSNHQCHSVDCLAGACWTSRIAVTHPNQQ